MRIVLIRAKSESTRTPNNSSATIIMGLQQFGFISEYEEWALETGEQSSNGVEKWPVRHFSADREFYFRELAQYVQRSGAPDIIWVDGRSYPPHVHHAMELCSQSFKIVYSKHPRPWNVKNLCRYDLCLVDEEWQIKKVKKRCPSIRCFVWDKSIDYDEAFFPMPIAKKYDLCYVATMRKGKNHELLFEAMSKLTDRRLSCVCVGGDQKANHEPRNRLIPLKKKVLELGLDVSFTGSVSLQEVNRYINMSKVGVMPSTVDAAPRAILEYMAADIPVLVSAGMLAGTRYVGPGSGLVKEPEEFHLGLAELLDNREKYSPRSYLLENYESARVISKFVELLKQTGIQLGEKNGLHISD
ncbi:glycosyltransferase family 4 protein [bacterium]|nr:glycosyltransferase family 4 protein [bacterium]